MAALSSSEGTDAHHAPTQAPQLQVLDYFIPGFSMFAGAILKYLHIDLNLYIPAVMFACAAIFLWNYASSYLWDQLESHFMSIVDIRTDDEIYNILMAWVATQRFSQGARRFVVNTNLNSKVWFMAWRYDDDDEDSDDDDDDQGSDVRNKKKTKALSYTPSFGSHYFWYRGRLLLFQRTCSREQSLMMVSEREEISISCLGRDPGILKELLAEARQMYMNRDKRKTLIYRGTVKGGTTEPTWQRCMARASRPFSTVILNEKTKSDLIDDVTDYLNPYTQRWYANRGIPYRRGYLLYGPPGTGKSSLSLALAGFFHMRIYIVSLSSMHANEETLASLFAELPRRCVVLLEDIDSAGLTHTRDENKNQGQSNNDALEPGQLTPGNGNTNNNNNQNGRLSLSGLLNILDGVASQEGRVLIMTTNHVDKLDKALIRPGRVDMIVKFGLADKDMTSAIFRAIFAHLEGDDGPPAREEGDTLLDPDARKARADEKKRQREAHDAEISVLASQFAAKIPALEFSPAEIQGFLMRNKRNAQAAVDGAEDFVEQTRRDRKEKEIKEAEERRKAEEKKVEEEKQKAEKKRKEEEEEKAEEEKEKKAEKEKEDGASKPAQPDSVDSVLKDKVEDSIVEDKPTTQDGPATILGVEDPTTTTAITTTTTAEGHKLGIDTSHSTTAIKGHSRQDSGYVTPAIDEA
ncbi:BCS1 N terminal-domain-containing protein [Xylariomycetidae sp. FL2044]|nr:BCS1 N terminal-domain-containing protein [Xylariomycetidae sp. FL2044]